MPSRRVAIETPFHDWLERPTGPAMDEPVAELVPDTANAPRTSRLLLGRLMGLRSSGI
jgi:hypothetical protein